MEKRLFVIRRALWDMNMPPSYLGAHYLAYAELLVLENQDRLTMVTKLLYPEVAARYHTSWKAVERDIRTVIAAGWERDKGSRLRSLTGWNQTVRPSPTDMIQLLARYFMGKPERFWREIPGYSMLTPGAEHPG